MVMPYPGLDITAGVFPFFRRGGATAWGAAGGGGAVSVSVAVTFCRFVRLAEDGFAGSTSGAGETSRAGALRFLVDGGGGGCRVDEAAEEAPIEAAGDSEELAACLAAALVILLLGGMSIGVSTLM